MKACPHCSTTYDDRVDFCFRDGTPLEASVVPVVSAAAALPEGPPGADLPTPGLKPNIGGGALSIADMLAVPEPGFAEVPRDTAKSAPVTREPKPPEAIPEEDLDEPEPLETPAAPPLVEAAPPVEEVAVEPAAEPGPVDPVLEEDLPPPVAFTEDTGIDTDALPPLSDPDPAPVEAPAPEVVPAVEPPEPEEEDKPPVAVMPPFTDEPEEESGGRGGMFLLLGAIVLLVGVATVAAMSMSDSDTPDEPISTTPTEPSTTPEPPTEPTQPAIADVDPTGEPTEPVEPTEEPVEPTEEPVEEPAEPAEEPVEPAEEPPPEVRETAEEPVTPTETTTPDPTEEGSPWGQEAEEPAATAELDPGAENMWGSEDDVKQGALSISTNPAGAVVWLGTERVGSSPVNTTVDFGSYTIKVELDGYRTETRSVDMQSSELAVPFELKPNIDKGTVHIYGKTGHLIYIDGSPVGTSPINTSLPPGRHTIRVVAEDGTSSTITAEVEFVDATTPYIIDLAN